jgi:hypothetical protein
MSFVRIPFIAVAPGSLMFTANPADNLPENEILVYGWDESVPRDHVAYGSVAIEISGLPVDEIVEPSVVVVPEPAIVPDSALPEEFAPAPVEAAKPVGVVEQQDAHEPPVVTLPEPAIVPESELREEIAPAPVEAVEPIAVVEQQDAHEPDGVLWDGLSSWQDHILRYDLRLDRLEGAYWWQTYCAASVVIGSVGVSPEANTVPLVIGEPTVIGASSFGLCESNATPNLQRHAPARPIDDVPIGVSPVRIISAVETTRSARRTTTDDLWVSSLSESRSWNDLADHGAEE